MIKQILFNPFQKIADYKALLWGMIIMVLTAIIASFSLCHFDGVIDAHIGAEKPIIYYFYEFLIDWGIVSIIFFSTGKILTKSKIRWIDVIGTAALARYPFFFVALLAFAMPEITPATLQNFKNIPDKELVILIIAGILMLLCIIWSIILLYNAFKTTCNLKGNRLIWGFVIALLISEILSKITFHYLYLHS